jgi:hypothetical protein
VSTYTFFIVHKKHKNKVSCKMVVYYHTGTGNLTMHFDIFELTSAFYHIQ